MIVHLWPDKELGGRLYLQVANLRVDQILDVKGRNLFLKSVFGAMHKIAATRYHLDNYRRIEVAEFDRAQRSFARDPNQNHEAFALIFELDAFLVQVKSSLDIMVKIFDAALGEGPVKTVTFAKKGEGLIKGLNQYKRRKTARKAAVDRVVQLIRTAKDSWLASAVVLRDKLNHHEALSGYHFTPVRTEGGLIAVQKPSLGSKDTVLLMTEIYEGNLLFQQDLMCFTLCLAAPLSLKLVEESHDRLGSLGPPDATRFVRWGWTHV